MHKETNKNEKRKQKNCTRTSGSRKKKIARKNILNNILKIGIPSLLVLVLIIFCVVGSLSEDESTDSSASTDTTTLTETDDVSTYSSDTSLTVEDGDTVNIDYVGSIDGVEFEGGNTNGSGADLVIGSGTYIDDFEEQLIGYHPGDTVEVNVTFPEDYGNEELKGKDALFEVIINGIY